MLDDDTSSIIVGAGNNRIAINLKPLRTDQTQSMMFPSVLIDMGDIEIEIRRTNKPTPVRSKSVASRMYEHGKQKKIEEKPKTSQSYWDYSTLHGPNMWSRIFPQLQCKKFQSPIRIYNDQSEYESVLARHPFIFDADENCCQILENTGHSFQVSGNGYSYITGGPVLDEYQFLQFHMHWGSNDNEGSEHVVDGIRSPAELHIVTWNTSKYKTPQEAVASEEFGGLMVFAVLINIIPTDNIHMDKLLELFPKITHKGEKINFDYNTISLRNLMPENIQDYYTYDGSLTTPMCNESVRWIVFRDKIGLSKQQINQLRQLKHTCTSDKSMNGYITRNYRSLMPLNGRIVYRSFR
ncbi:unnamed protein product [Adineta steineri]|uniref:carbonic anhydrase n=1 Tax=Adineta steineri TaxID=433720 RepID=A0A815W7D9_9BILA|nr:unnamed protein product [Adineta steineri]CAF1544839.1 unnamed protein product [Adineta steineri]